MIRGGDPDEEDAQVFSDHRCQVELGWLIDPAAVGSSNALSFDEGMTMGQLPRRARAYLALVYATAGIGVIWGTTGITAWTSTIVLAAVYVIVERENPVQGHVAVSLGSVVSLAAIPIVGVPVAMLIGLAGDLRAYHKHEWHIRVFNAAAQVLQIGGAGLVYTVLHDPTSRGFAIVKDFLPLLGANATYLVINGTLVCLIVWFANGIPPRQTWLSEMRASALPYLAYGIFGSVLYVLWINVGLGPFAALFLLLPLQVARWTYAQAVEQQQAYDNTVAALIRAVETKDHYTRGHSERVARLVAMMAEALRMPSERAASLRYAGLLHDVGKLGVPTRVLQKSGRLTGEEFASVKLHPLRGLELVREIEFLNDALAGIMHHHERLDGRGYPMGLKGDEIPEFARAIAVADAFDSMTSTRSYRGARSVEDALVELEHCVGTQFDERMVNAFAQVIRERGWTPPEPDPDAAPLVAAQAPYDHDHPFEGLEDLT